MNDLEEIKKKLDIADLIGSYIELKKAGRDFKGLCPFHNEKTPSFVVSPSKQIWHCFGCNKGGDHFTFVMEHEGLDFKEAALKLAEKAGVDLKLSSHDAGESKFKKRLKEINAKAAEIYQKELFTNPEAAPAKEYLKKRGLTKETIIEFGIGYSPRNSSVIKKLQKEGFTQDELIKSGVAIPGRELMDRFRGRITFPLNEHTGDTVAFTARVLDDSLPKYLNSPETKVYRKSHLLYGLDKAKQSLRDNKELIVVEGNMDVIVSHQNGFSNTVATSGTAISPEQLETIKRYTDELVLSLDVDKAGVEATKRAIKLSAESGLTMRVAAAASGKDPADAITNDKDSYKKAIEGSIDYIEYLILRAKEEHGTASASAKSAIAKEILPYLALVGIVERADYLATLSDTIKIPVESLSKALVGFVSPAPKNPPKDNEEQLDPKTKHLNYIRVLLIAFPDIRKELTAKHPELFTDTPGISREDEIRFKTLALELEKNLDKDPLEDALEVAGRIKVMELTEEKIRIIEGLSAASKSGDMKTEKKLKDDFKKLIERERGLIKT